MTENLLSEPVLKDLYVGPLKSFLDCFETLLFNLGYVKASIKEKIRLVANFWESLNQQHVELKKVSERSLSRASENPHLGPKEFPS